MDMQVVVNLLFDEVANIFVDTDTIGRHRGGAQFYLCLTFEDGFFDIDGDGCHDTGSDITILVFVEKILDGAGYMLLEGTLMRSTLCGVLSVDKRVILLAILVGMGEGNLDIVTLQMDDGIERIIGHTVLEQILQSVTRQDAPAIIHDGEPYI